MLQYVNVRFDNTSIHYCFWTHLTDLTKDDLVLVETINGIKTAKVTGYATSAEKKAKATKWVLCKLDIDRIKRNLDVELEEEGISKNPTYNKPFPSEKTRKQRYKDAKNFIEQARRAEAWDTILRDCDDNLNW